jgi:hypothetical protein
MVRRAGVCVPRGGVAAAAGYGYGAGPGYAYSPVLTPGYASRPGYMAGPTHVNGGPVRSGDMCWKDDGSHTQAQFGYWAACPK